MHPIDPTNLRMRDSELFAGAFMLVFVVCIVLLCVGLS